MKALLKTAWAFQKQQGEKMWKTMRLLQVTQVYKRISFPTLSPATKFQQELSVKESFELDDCLNNGTLYEMDSEIKEEVPVHEEFILCCGVETQVLKCGPWTNLFNEPRANRPKLLIFIITDVTAPVLYIPPLFLLLKLCHDQSANQRAYYRI
ncbi:hypothetical protein PANDA_020512 [Ailuropoda melanoleuca]|uniref:Uncharacterized protein n=1 Tax=Ailuropoda melanoleuca TaxID=9646 RepID=D2I4I7_AILME|nr:hypothetical protein PANDA_020512 [Ailuropoda melanoleuca]